MSLIRFQSTPLYPLAGLSRLPELRNELFDRLFNAPEAKSWVPALDVYEEKDNYVVKVELPGVNKEDVKLSLEQGTLTITGERKSETKQEGTEVHYTERFHGRFQRVIDLPESVAADKVTAQYKDGILTVTLPKSEHAKPKQIDIQVS